MAVLGKKIVVLEDDRQLQHIMLTVLQQHGFEVLMAENGYAGEQVIRDVRPDLAIMDVMMPGKTGLDVCVDLKRDVQLQSMPIIMMTCLTHHSSRNDDYWRQRSGADEFLTKPFALQRLVHCVKGALEA